MYKTINRILEAIGLLIGGVIGALFIWMLYVMIWVMFGEI
jgi:tetrahydromethanopterin S-methyltransferase subunit G